MVGWELQSTVTARSLARSLAELPNCEMPRSPFSPFQSLSGCETKGARIDKLQGWGGP